MTVKIILVTASMLIACKSNQEKAFERVANALNPVIVSHRQDLTRMLSLPSDQHEEIFKLCLGQETLLDALAANWDALEARELKLPQPGLGIPSRAVRMRDRFDPAPCGSVAIERNGLARCAAWCLESWRDLADRVEVLRRHAKDADVHIEVLVAR